MILSSLNEINKRPVGSVCFTGHRQFSAGEAATASKLLDDIIDTLADPDGEFKTVSFYAGGAVGFDTLAAEAVLRAKEKYPSVRLVLLLPCKGQDRGWTPEDKQKYADILKAADSFTFYGEHYFRGCMQIRDRALADNAELCIAWLRPGETDGGTVFTVKYAEKSGKTVLNLCPDAKGGDEELRISF